MDIDWITVSAQIVNFLILVGLLKHFLYQPVINAMDRREQRITDRLKEARERESEAEDRVKSYQQKSDELDEQRDQILAQAREDAEEERKKLLEDARDEVAESKHNWRQQLSQEKREFMDNLRNQTLDAVQAIARKALGELADAELEPLIIDKFISRLAELDEKTRKQLTNASGKIQVSTNFELDSATRGRLTRAIHKYLDDEVDVSYAQSSELLCGVELRRGESRVSWNFAEFSDDLSSRFEEAFRPADQPEARE